VGFPPLGLLLDALRRLVRSVEAGRTGHHRVGEFGCIATDCVGSPQAFAVDTLLVCQFSE
jgi:hypothetical protein